MHTRNWRWARADSARRMIVAIAGLLARQGEVTEAPGTMHPATRQHMQVLSSPRG